MVYVFDTEQRITGHVDDYDYDVDDGECRGLFDSFVEEVLEMLFLSFLNVLHFKF